MKKWGWAALAVLVSCLPIAVTRATSDGLMTDTDTIAILQGIERAKNPWGWFVGDWPLGNHFYRPITTLTFEIDHALNPWKGAQYGTTNAILAIACVWALFWLLRELLNRPLAATAATCLFASWIVAPNYFAPLTIAFPVVATVGLVISLVMRRHTGAALAGVLVSSYAALEFAGMLQIRGGSLDWIPGRTATTMTLFALLAMAMVARYFRLTAQRVDRAPTALDRPATKNTDLRGPPSAFAWVWVVGAWLMGACALGAYEQAVMLPACVAGLAVAFRLYGWRTSWWPHVGFWCLLVGYLVVRKAVIPPGTSTYQLQQYRSSYDVYLTLAEYVFPAARPLVLVFNQLEFGLLVLLITQGQSLYGILSSTVSLFYVWGKRIGALVAQDWTPLIGYALSFLAFLPMAWLKAFPHYNHYHFWSMALRSLYAIALVALAWKLVLLGVSQRPVQAPPRSAD